MTTEEKDTWAVVNAHRHIEHRPRVQWITVAVIAAAVLIALLIGAFVAKADATENFYLGAFAHPEPQETRSLSPIPAPVNIEASGVPLTQTGGSLNVNCTAGCSGSGGGNAAAGLTGASVPTSAGYTGFNSSGNLVGVSTVNPLPVVQQGSVAVTGTFFQGTQPVSLATLPALTAGSAVIGHVIADSGSTTAVSGNVTAVQATGSNLHVAVDSAPTTAVTGTFFQATQPVSAAALPLPSGAATSTIQTNGTQVTQVSNFPATQPISGTVTVSNPSSGGGGTLGAPSVVTVANPGQPASINVTNTPFHPVPVSISNPAQLASLINGNCNASTVNPYYYCGNNTASVGAPGFVPIPPQAVQIGATPLSTQYVATTGNDANDGFSWAKAKLTVAAGIAALPQGSLGGGTVEIACGTYVGPTAAQLFSGVYLRGNCAGRSIGITSAKVVLTYTSTLNLSAVENIRFQHVTLDWGSGLGGLQITNSEDLQFSYLSLNQCGNATTPCILLSAVAGGFGSASHNTFDHTEIEGNTTAGTAGAALACIQLVGSGTVNAGPSATQNSFYQTKCRGYWVGGIDAELNSDTNFFWGFQIFQETPTVPTNSYILGFNLTTPASNQDADASYYYAVNATLGAGVTSWIRAGATNGNVIQFTTTAGGVPIVSYLGPTASTSWTIQTAPLGGTPNSQLFAIGNGTISACWQSSGCPSATVAPGDLTAARSATVGVLNLGTDGANIFRSGASFVGVCTAGTGGCTWQTPEIATPAGVASQGVLWPGSDDHLEHYNSNNAGVQTVPYRVTMASSSGAVTSTTLGQPGGMTALTWNVAAGRTYQFACDLYYQISSVTGVPSPAMALGGTATMTSMWAVADGYQTATLTTEGTVTTAVATKSTIVTTASTPVTTNLPFKYHGAFTVNAAGTVLIQAANFLNAGASMTIGTLGSCTLQ